MRLRAKSNVGEFGLRMRRCRDVESWGSVVCSHLNSQLLFECPRRTMVFAANRSIVLPGRISFEPLNVVLVGSPSPFGDLIPVLHIGSQCFGTWKCTENASGNGSGKEVAAAAALQQ